MYQVRENNATIRQHNVRGQSLPRKPTAYVTGPRLKNSRRDTKLFIIFTQTPTIGQFPRLNKFSVFPCIFSSYLGFGIARLMSHNGSQSRLVLSRPVLKSETPVSYLMKGAYCVT